MCSGSTRTGKGRQRHSNKCTGGRSGSSGITRVQVVAQAAAEMHMQPHRQLHCLPDRPCGVTHRVQQHAAAVSMYQKSTHLGQQVGVLIAHLQEALNARTAVFRALQSQCMQVFAVSSIPEPSPSCSYVSATTAGPQQRTACMPSCTVQGTRHCMSTLHMLDHDVVAFTPLTWPS